jgi:hypothetical protein
VTEHTKIDLARGLLCNLRKVWLENDKPLIPDRNKEYRHRELTSTSIDVLKGERYSFRCPSGHSAAGL